MRYFKTLQYFTLYVELFFFILYISNGILCSQEFDLNDKQADDEQVGKKSKPIDCADILKGNAEAQSGVYRIWPRSQFDNLSIEVYCDMEDDGGAWTVIQRRGNNGRDSLYFSKNWNCYKNGFGNVKKDMWLGIKRVLDSPAFTKRYKRPFCVLGNKSGRGMKEIEKKNCSIGNDNIFVLTNQRPNMIKIVLTDWEGETIYATYDYFWITDESTKYKLHAGGHNGTADDLLSKHEGKIFSTKDSTRCQTLLGGWWYEKCNPNGFYYKFDAGSYSRRYGVCWRSKYPYNSLMNTVLKIRPRNFKMN